MKNKKKKYLWIALTLLLAAAGIVCILFALFGGKAPADIPSATTSGSASDFSSGKASEGRKSDEGSFTPSNKTLPSGPIGNTGVRITAFGSYAGPFVEDGSDELVSGVAAVTLENEGDAYLRLMEFSLVDGAGNRFEFSLTTLFPGQKVTVLEKARRSFDPTADYTGVELGNIAYFDEKPSLLPDKLMIVSSGDTVTVENISDETIPAGRIYFKSVSGDRLIGGITYSASFGQLAPGEKQTLAPGHYTDGNSKILFADYAGS